jgi:hypothetical protein
VGSGACPSSPLSRVDVEEDTLRRGGEEESAALEREARASGRTKSQLIREAIDRAYLRGGDRNRVQRALKRSAGAWRGKRPDGAAYVDRLRSGRLGRLHGG